MSQPGQPSLRLREEEGKEEGEGLDRKVFQHTAMSLTQVSIAVTKYRSLSDSEEKEFLSTPVLKARTLRLSGSILIVLVEVRAVCGGHYLS